MSKNTNHRFKKRASILALASCIGFSPMLAEAAGLGRISVQSALGQPLRAEIELNATREEMAGMVAKVAAPDAFKLAGIEYASTLSAIRFAIDKRANGQAYVRVTTDRPVSDPFVDMLIELTWSSGRLVREYTFLLDPPELSVAGAPAPVVEVPAVRAERPVETKPVPAPVVETKPAARPAPEAAKKPAASTVEVKRGDTLSKIANSVKPEEVSLDQMLVGLFRANQEAFDGGNMNRLKAGKILNVPATEELTAVAPKEAHKEVVAQASDWQAYRRKLAGVAAQAPAADTGGKQEVAGKITAKVETKAPAAESKDQVKVSKTETAAGAPALARKAGDEDRIAKEKSLKEAQERVASLEKNVTDLQKMVELKNQGMAEAQKQAAAGKPPVDAKKPEPAAAAKPAEAAKAAAPPPSVLPPATAVKPPEPAKPAEAAKPVEPPKPAEAAKPAEAPKPEAAKPPEAAKAAESKPPVAPKPKPKAPPPPPPEPTFMEEFGGMLASLVAVLAVLGGGFVFWKRRKKAAEEAPGLALNALSQPSLGANSVFRATGGQSVDTSNVTPATTDFSQAGPGMIDTDEVDPVAEAEVYMAYGRDAQAEEILLEAMQKDSKRLAIHLKLLEIYSNRKSLKQFETLASELYGQTNGVGSEWEKAAAMGQRLDPTNPLYSRGGGAAASFDSVSTLVAASPEALKSTVMMPGTLAQMAEAAQSPFAETTPATQLMPPAAAAAPAAPASAGTLDFDLGIEPVSPSAAAVSAEPKLTFDFDLGAEAAPAAAPVAEAADSGFPDLAAAESTPEAAFSGDSTIIQEQGAVAPEVADISIDFALPEMDLAKAAPAPAPEATMGALDFDLGFGDAAAAPAAPAPSEVIDLGAVEAPAVDFDIRLSDSVLQPASPQGMDLSAISLDLDVEPPAAAAAEDDFGKTMLVAPGSDLAATYDSGSPEVATKLDLAKAYEEMGDHEGARELLQEVIAEGNSTQKATAQAMLAKLG